MFKEQKKQIFVGETNRKKTNKCVQYKKTTRSTP